MVRLTDIVGPCRAWTANQGADLVLLLGYLRDCAVKGPFGKEPDSRRNVSDLDSLKKTFQMENQNH